VREVFGHASVPKSISKSLKIDIEIAIPRQIRPEKKHSRENGHTHKSRTTSTQ
jgi:hypothetical protein